jgi:hypothetical protein
MSTVTEVLTEGKVKVLLKYKNGCHAGIFEIITYCFHVLYIENAHKMHKCAIHMPKNCMQFEKDTN